MSDENDELGSNLQSNPPAPRTRRAPKGMPERTWIILEDNDEIPPTGQYFGHNGVGYLLIPGEPAEVPFSIIEILDHAVVTIPVTDKTTKRVIGHRERMRFPYRRVAAPENIE